MPKTEQWIPMRDAAKLLRVSYYKISQLVNSGDLDTRENIRDKRAKLINMEQAKRVLGITDDTDQ